VIVAVVIVAVVIVAVVIVIVGAVTGAETVEHAGGPEHRMAGEVQLADEVEDAGLVAVALSGEEDRLKVPQLPGDPLQLIGP
jgi:hypothetical protein